MKNSIIIFNIAFLLFGNLVFSNIHYFHHHDHNHDHTFEYNECIDCITFDNNENYTLDSNEIKLSNNFINEFLLNPIIVPKLSLSKAYLSRAPPSPKK